MYCKNLNTYVFLSRALLKTMHSGQTYYEIHVIKVILKCKYETYISLNSRHKENKNKTVPGVVPSTVNGVENSPVVVLVIPGIENKSVVNKIFLSL